MATSYKTYHRCLGEGGFGGVDFSSAPTAVSPRRFSALVNLYRDYESEQGGAVEVFPGFRVLASLGGAVHGIWEYAPLQGTESYGVVHAGRALYVFPLEERDRLPLHLTQVTGALADCDSVGFAVADKLYLLDGTHYFALSYDAGADSFSLESVADRYVPRTYQNGGPYEQRNMLCDRFVERYHLWNTADYADASPALLYQVSSHAERTCRVVGISTPTPLVLVPGTTTIDGVPYRVTEIAARAFQNDGTIQSLSVAEGVETVGRYALNSCPALGSVHLPTTLRRIEQAAFAYCSALSDLTLGGALEAVERYAFHQCTALTSFSYEGSAAAWAEVTVGDYNAPLDAAEVTPDSWEAFSERRCFYPIHEPCRSVAAVRLDGRALPDARHTLTDDSHFAAGKVYYTLLGSVYTEATVSAGAAVPPDTYYERHPTWYQLQSAMVSGKDYYEGVVLYLSDHRAVSGGVLDIEGTAYESEFTAVAQAMTFLDANPTYTGSACEALSRCTVCAVYDGRIFLTGSPGLPNTVFYSQRDLTGHNNPAYFGVCNFMDDGIGNTPNRAMIATASALAVLKGDTLTDGSIYYHTAADGPGDLLPRIYPAVQGLAGLGCVGTGCNFLDDPVFLSRKGLEAVGKEQVNLERALTHRSSPVDARLLGEDLSRTKMAEWKGYLLLLCPGGRVYLADSRQLSRHRDGSLQYEWYFLEGVGGYTDDLSVYRYASALPPGVERMTLGEADLLLSPTPDGLPFDSLEAYEAEYGRIYHGTAACYDNAEGTGTPDLLPVSYVSQTDPDGATRLCLLSPSSEKTGGTFHPATAVAALGELLLFGTGAGHLLCVNTDRRGTDGAERHAIPRACYRYADHRYTAGFVSCADMAGLPHLTKDTVRNSTVVQSKPMPGGGFSVSVSTDNQSWQSLGKLQEGRLDFGDLDFGHTLLQNKEVSYIACKEKTRRWVQKQYAVYAELFEQPFGIYTLAYRYTVKGRVRNR